MNLGRLCLTILKSDKEISGYGQLAQHAIFAYHMLRQTPLIALPPLRFPSLMPCLHKYVFTSFSSKTQTSHCVFTLRLHENNHKQMIVFTENKEF